MKKTIQLNEWALAAAAALLLLGACGRPQEARYTAEYELNFMRACQTGGSSVAVCSCVWDKIVAEIPVDDFEAFEGLPVAERETHPMTLKVRGFGDACRADP